MTGGKLSEEYSIEDLKHIRVGYIDQDRYCDKVIEYATLEIPETNIVRWKTSASHHVLFVADVCVLRIWTDTKKTCIVDLIETLQFKSDPVPTSCYRKCKPLTRRVYITDSEQIVNLVTKVKQTYGV